MGLIVVIGVLVMICVMSWWSCVREQHRFEYGHFEARNVDTLCWYLARRNKSCDKAPAKRRPRRAF